VRFLPNPHYEPELRPLTGFDERIVDYVGRDGRLQELYDRLMPLLDYVLPQYIAEGKAHLMVAIGAREAVRSVAITEHLAAHYRGDDRYFVEVATGTSSARRAAVTAPRGYDRPRDRPPRPRGRGLGRSGAFYDAVFYSLGIRRLHENEHVIGWGKEEPRFWLTARAAPRPGFGTVASRPSGRRRSTPPTTGAGLAAGGGRRRAAPVCDPSTAALLRGVPPGS
jgi:hypothetical protein